MPNDLSLRYLGHSAFQIRHGEFDILIDPFLTHNPKAAVAAKDLTPTHIIVTHGHGDHLGDTELIAKRMRCQVITVHEIAEWLERQGVNAWGMGTGGGRDFEFGRVSLTLAHHSSSLPDGTYAGNPAGVILQLDGRTIYHAGDTGLFLDMELIGRRFAIDVALLPIGDNYTMGIDDAVAAVEMLKPKVTIPMHFNTYPAITADPDEFTSKLAAKGYRSHVLAPGEEYAL
jgi:L-ascorbate metabolism protein UlaG (beta-lactamase superfamily)